MKLACSCFPGGGVSSVFKVGVGGISGFYRGVLQEENWKFSRGFSKEFAQQGRFVTRGRWRVVYGWGSFAAMGRCSSGVVG